MLRCAAFVCASLLVVSSFRLVKKSGAKHVEQDGGGWPFYGDTFWGIPLDANPCTFIIDKSNSMHKTAMAGGSWSGGTQTRDEASFQELQRSLGILTWKWGYKFNVITFAKEATAVFPDVSFATFGNVSTALQQAAPGGLALYTNTYEALRLAYASPTAPRKIYLLSDGLPTPHFTPFSNRAAVMDGILRDVKKWDNGRGIRLNTILLNGQGSEKDIQARDWTQRLAAENGGVFREVPF